MGEGGQAATLAVELTYTLSLIYTDVLLLLHFLPRPSCSIRYFPLFLSNLFTRASPVLFFYHSSFRPTQLKPPHCPSQHAPLDRKSWRSDHAAAQHRQPGSRHTARCRPRVQAWKMQRRQRHRGGACIAMKSRMKPPDAAGYRVKHRPNWRYMGDGVTSPCPTVVAASCWLPSENWSWPAQTGGRLDGSLLADHRHLHSYSCPPSPPTCSLPAHPWTPRSLNPAN